MTEIFQGGPKRERVKAADEYHRYPAGKNVVTEGARIAPIVFIEEVRALRSAKGNGKPERLQFLD